MKARVKIIAAALLLATLCAGGIAYVRHQRDEARLWRAFDRLVTRVEKHGAEPLLEAAARARETAAVFTAEPRVVLPPFVEGVRPREELTALVFQFRSMVEQLTVRVERQALEIAPDRRRAQMRLRATAEARIGRSVEREFRSVLIEWERDDEGWRIATITGDEALRRLPPPP